MQVGQAGQSKYKTGDDASSQQQREGPAPRAFSLSCLGDECPRPWFLPRPVRPPRARRVSAVNGFPSSPIVPPNNAPDVQEAAQPTRQPPALSSEPLSPLDGPESDQRGDEARAAAGANQGGAGMGMFKSAEIPMRFPHAPAKLEPLNMSLDRLPTPAARAGLPSRLAPLEGVDRQTPWEGSALGKDPLILPFAQATRRGTRNCQGLG